MHRFEQREIACRALGADPNKPLPAEPRGPVTLELPQLGATPVRLAETGTQRVQGQCPSCQRWFALGNLHQHAFGNPRSNSYQPGCRQNLWER